MARRARRGPRQLRRRSPLLRPSCSVFTVVRGRAPSVKDMRPERSGGGSLTALWDAPVRADGLSPDEVGKLARGETVIRSQTVERGDRRYVGGVTYTMVDDSGVASTSGSPGRRARLAAHSPEDPLRPRRWRREAWRARRADERDGRRSGHLHDATPARRARRPLLARSRSTPRHRRRMGLRPGRPDGAWPHAGHLRRAHRPGLRTATSSRDLVREPGKSKARPQARPGVLSVPPPSV